MNRRSFFALLPALPFVATASTQASRVIHIRGRHSGYFDGAQLAEQLKSLRHRLPARAGRIAPLAQVHAKEFVGWKMSPGVGMETYAEALKIEMERVQAGAFDGTDETNIGAGGHQAVAREGHTSRASRSDLQLDLDKHHTQELK
jgi:hypothetical protein